MPVGFAEHSSVLSVATRNVDSANHARKKFETGFECVLRCLSVKSAERALR